MREPPAQKSEWLERARSYAALAATHDAEEAQLLLSLDGLEVPRRRLESYQRQAERAIASLRESGLAAALVGPEGQRTRRLARIDALCQYLETRLQQEEPPLDRDLAGLLQQYRELMELLLEQDPPRGGPGPAASPAAGEVASALNLLEAMHHERPPTGAARSAAPAAEDVHAAARRLAAATGYAFPDPESAEPDVAAADGGV